MDARTAATQLSYARIGFGVALVLLPRAAARGWSGGDAVRGGGRVLSVALGARDLALGLGTLRALKSGTGERDWLLARAPAGRPDLVGPLPPRPPPPGTGSVGRAGLAAHRPPVSP